jgi:predicted dehydrogenase
MVNAARSGNVVVNVDFTGGGRPTTWQRARDQQGRLGKLSQIIIEIGGERAMLWRNHPHAIDLMAYYADADPECGSSASSRRAMSNTASIQGRRRQDHVERAAANYYVAFRNGVRGYLTGMKDYDPGPDRHVARQLGSIQVDEQSATSPSEMIGSGATAGTHHAAALRPIVPQWTVAGWRAGIRDVIAGLETGRRTAGTAEDAWRSAAIPTRPPISRRAGNAPADRRPAGARVVGGEAAGRTPAGRRRMPCDSRRHKGSDGQGSGRRRRQPQRRRPVSST